MGFKHFSYVSGWFLHDTQPVGPDSGFRAHTLPQFGIIDRVYDARTANDSRPQWERLRDHLRYLNSKDSASEKFKILFVARHGEGVHNVKEREVGRHEWQQYWSKLDGDGRLEWADAVLTEKGAQQAQDLGNFWNEAIARSKVCPPTAFYTSPLRRCLQTIEATWSKVSGISTSAAPIVREQLREIFGVHTCDRRGPTSWIREHYPDFVLPPDTPEEDPWWTPDHRETLEQHSQLWREFLCELFDGDDSTYVSITTHSGAIRALYHALGHPDVWTAAGSCVPIAVRARRMESA